MDKHDLVDIYNSSLPLKLIIQNIPYIGSSLDTILSHKGGEWRDKRFEAFIHNLDEKIRANQTENSCLASEIKQKVDSEDFYYLFIQAAQKSSMTHKIEKIANFANLLKNYLIRDISNEEYLIDIFLDITDNLSEYEYDDFYLYSYKRLEKYDLVQIRTVEEYGGQTSAGWKRQGQSQTVNFHYSKKDEVSLSDFGKKYIDWVIN